MGIGKLLYKDIPDFFEMNISELGLGNSINVGIIELDEKFSLITPEDTVLASVTHAMKEIEPVIEVDEDELFLDEDGEPIAEGEGGDERKEGDKLLEKGEEKPVEKGENSEE